MLRQIGKRLATAIPSLIGVIIVTFLLTRVLPGDTAAYFAGPAATPQAIDEIRKSLGLDQPLPEQFVALCPRSRARRSRQLADHRPAGARRTSRARLPASAELTLLGLILAMLIAVPLGILAAVQAGLVDRSCLPRGRDRRRLAAGVLHRPAAGLCLLFHARLVAGAARAARRVLLSAPPHVTGFYLIDSLLAGDFETFRAALGQLVLPALTLAIFSLAPIARMTRASMLAVLASDFVRTARASGLSPRTVIVTYAFRNAMLPVVTTLGMVFSFLLGANVLVEKVFAWPGIGSYAVEALIASDFAPVQGFVLTMAILYVLLNLLIDMLYGVIDPRVRIEG